MKKTGFIVVIVLLLVIAIGLGVVTFLLYKDREDIKNKNEDLTKTINVLEKDLIESKEEINDLKDKIENPDKVDDKKTTGSTATLAEEEHVREAIEKHFNEFVMGTYNGDGTDNTLDEYRIDVIEIIDKDELNSYFGESPLEFEDSIPADIRYSVKPKNEESYGYWMAGGECEADGTWIHKGAVVEVGNTTKGYAVINIGTGW